MFYYILGYFAVILLLIMGKNIRIKIEPKDIKKLTANLADSGEVPHVIKNTANFYIKKR